MLLLRAIVPAGITLGLGALVRAITEGRSVDGALVVVTVCFALASVSGPLHTQLGAIVGDRTSGYLQAELTRACATPAGIAHLERPGLAAELVAARDFDLGIMGPPLNVSMGFIGAGMVELLGGVAQAVALATVTWWGALVLAGAWIVTHWLLRGSSYWAKPLRPEVQLEAYGRPHRRPVRYQGCRARLARRAHGPSRHVRRALHHPSRRLPAARLRQRSNVSWIAW